jgi:hypothetical protein
MKKNVLVFGAVAGLITAAWGAVSVFLCYTNGNAETSMVLGYASMLLAFSLIFVCVKNYRDKYNGGIISFGKAFQIGIYITLIASTIYVIVWLFEYYLFVPDFMDKYAAHIISRAQAGGASVAEIATKTKEMTDMKEQYKNPIVVILYTYAEIFPVGLLVTFITALILKRKTNRDGVMATA